MISIFGVCLAYLYQMEGLKMCCIDQLKDALDYEWKDVHTILQELDSLGSPCEDLKMVCM